MTNHANHPAPGHVDVLIVGAGLSGIDAACRLRIDAPGASFAILEAREASGGTWDLFRYPGVRSDSDIFTLGYPFRPWRGRESIVSGEQIWRYVRETAAAYEVDSHVTYHSRVVAANWSAADSRWTVTVEDTRTRARTSRTCGFLFLCSGYYRYDEGYTPDWPGRDLFTGQILHPQHWPATVDVAGKKVVVIGSGATAVTLVPALAELGAKVTMLQRSPSFILTLRTRDPIGDLLRAVLPVGRAHAAVRWKNAKIATALYTLCRRYPVQARAALRRTLVRKLPAGYDVDTHFRPAYEPWDQRMCIVPDDDFLDAIRSGQAEMVTDHIESFTENGLLLRSGARLDADIVITATGLNLLPLGGIELSVDGVPTPVSGRVAYQGMMLDGVPNMAFALGYTNASWTLKVDLVCAYVARLVRFLRENGYAGVTPRLPASSTRTTPFIDMTSGYFERARASLPLQGDRAPWRLQQHYFKDAALFRGSFRGKDLEFHRATAAEESAAHSRVR